MQHPRQMKPNPKALDWRDPEMPLVRTRKSGENIEIAPERVTRHCAQQLLAPVPEWRNDPTYNMRRKK